jgi:hypothetical protein
VDLASAAPVEQMTPFSAVLLARTLAHSVNVHSGSDIQECIRPVLALLRRARRQYPGDFWVNYELALYLGESFPNSDLEEALRYATAAVSLRPQSFGPHLTLGRMLIGKGHYEEAVAELQEAVRLERPGQDRRPSSRWLRRAERFAAVGNRLPGLLKGELEPVSPEEYWALAFLHHTRTDHLASAARCYARAFAAQPAMADDLTCGDRYNAACVAALAACGQGRDPVVSDSERAGFRLQALHWLQADLASWSRRLAQEPTHGAEVKQFMQLSLTDPELDSVRNPKALARLPEAERREWTKLWQDVAALARRAAEAPNKPASRTLPPQRLSPWFVESTSCLRGPRVTRFSRSHLRARAQGLPTLGPPSQMRAARALHDYVYCASTCLAAPICERGRRGCKGGVRARRSERLNEPALHAKVPHGARKRERLKTRQRCAPLHHSDHASGCGQGRPGRTSRAAPQIVPVPNPCSFSELPVTSDRNCRVRDWSRDIAWSNSRLAAESNQRSQSGADR